ncbi:hypothetical protein DK853_34065, partial [Klebsiella oxytoca]
QLLGDEGGVGRRKQIAQQCVEAHGQGDGEHAPAAGSALLPPAGERPPPAAVEHDQSTGGEYLADDHARHDEAYHPLRVLGQKEGQK